MALARARARARFLSMAKRRSRSRRKAASGSRTARDALFAREFKLPPEVHSPSLCHRFARRAECGYQCCLRIHWQPSPLSEWLCDRGLLDTRTVAALVHFGATTVHSPSSSRTTRSPPSGTCYTHGVKPGQSRREAPSSRPKPWSMRSCS